MPRRYSHSVTYGNGGEEGRTAKGTTRESASCYYLWQSNQKQDTAVVRSLLALLLLYFCSQSVLAGNGETTDQPRMSFGMLRDTLYVLDSVYMEIRLDRQMIYLRHRSGSVETFPCSTGDPRIPEGIATRPGIFTIQSKASKAFSAAFQVYLNFWMGFDGGIGLHGLDGRSYYRFLGRRPSSHGCVRIANETGAKLFRKVRLGTVVFVHSGTPARLVRFGDPTRTDLLIMNRIDNNLLDRRTTAVEELRWDDSSLVRPIAIAPGYRFPKIQVGTASRTVLQFMIPVRQDAFVPPSRLSSRATSVVRFRPLPGGETLPDELLSDIGLRP